ncbi:MAG TPA: hypothetical protein EYO51_07055 [Methylococcaceae bacterium]|nr:hypothetical protein [Methylococcaceae bacterium]HIN67807.1 hypothetical protein [Methylococcales bacterium]HIO12837.1 hypothetical protein [Methylococcales bacterium]HIO44278.1 hypothetical protein [Methylococcales bacterium]
MKITKLRFRVFFYTMALTLFLTACSDVNPKETTLAPPTAVDSAQKMSFDHRHNKARDMDKHPFEHKFAQQCIARELENSINKEIDRARFKEPCLCIATYLMKKLTAKEAQKFLREQKHTQSLRIRYENAAYHCLQKKQAPQPPTIFKTR